MNTESVALLCLTLLVACAMMVTHSLDPLWLMFLALWFL